MGRGAQADGKTKPELSAETLEIHRYWHTVWNLSALILINGCNFLWLHRTLTRGVNYWSDLLCDVAMATYQLCETAVDIRRATFLDLPRTWAPASRTRPFSHVRRWPHVTSSLRAAITHHLVTMSGILYLRLIAQTMCVRPFLVDCIKHELVLFGECQNMPRMAMRIMTRGTLQYTLMSHLSDLLLLVRCAAREHGARWVLAGENRPYGVSDPTQLATGASTCAAPCALHHRLLWWPIIPIRNYYLVWGGGESLTVLVMALKLLWVTI